MPKFKDMYSIPETAKPKPGIIDQFIEKFDKLQGGDFCYGIRSFTVDVAGTEPIIRHLVLDRSILAYETAMVPQVLEELVNKLNGEKTAPTLNQLKILSHKVWDRIRYPVRNKGYLSNEGYILSRNAALFMALCLHMVRCSTPHNCAWNELLADIKQPPVKTLPV